MAGSESPRSPTRVQPAAVAAVALTVFMLTATLVWQPWNQGQGPGATASPGASPGGQGSPAPSASPGEAWQSIDLEPLLAVATLEPSSRDQAGVRPDATFTLTSLASDTAITLAKRVEVSPATKLAIRSGSDTTQVTLKPETALTLGTLYRFGLRAEDGTLAASWAFRVRSPLHVVNVIPEDQTGGVPVNTGIEVTFDQDGAAAIDDYFSIDPAVKGRFERHGRTQVFVPDALAPKTLYTVTVKAGLPREGTDLTLERDVVIRFETDGKQTLESWVRPGRAVAESSPAEPPILGVDVVRYELAEGQTPVPADINVVVYRLPSRDVAAKTLETFLAAPRGFEFHSPLMPTKDLPVTARFTAALEPISQTTADGADEGSNIRVIRFPDALAQGWYIVELAGSRTTHAFLQVTPVSAWVSVLTDRTVVWVNDVATGRAVKDAEVSIAGGATLGKSDASGLMVAPTPQRLIPPTLTSDLAPRDPAPMLTVTAPGGASVLLPFEVDWQGEIYRGEWWEKGDTANPIYWSLLQTDRSIFRTTDRIEVWGYLRGRDDNAVPGSVEVRVVSTDSVGVDEPPTVARVTAEPDRNGTFSATLRLARAPLGSYNVQSLVDGRVVSSRWIDVTVIRKPAYRLALDTDRHAVIVGTKVAWTVTATFFDDAPVPSLPLLRSGDEGGIPAGDTDATGHATFTLPAPLGDADAEDARQWDLETRPAVGEEGDISAWAKVVVFPTAYDLEGTGSVEKGRLRVTGSLEKIDLANAEAAVVAGTWGGDPVGPAVGAAAVRAVVTELIPVRRQVGTDYDFIEKVTVPRYEYETRREELRTLTVKTAADGKLSFDLAVPDPKHDYEVVLTTKDEAGRVARRTFTSGSAQDLWWLDAGIRFQTVEGKDAGSDPYGIGEKVVWRMTDDGTPIPANAADRYLYIVAQRGLRTAVVSDSPTFERTFATADAPGVFIIGVRFTGTTYAPKAAAWARFDEAERKIDVAVTADRGRYRPGEDVALTVRTTTDGRPVAASVVLQAVDEKIFAMGGASVPYPLEWLYTKVDSGIVRLTSTHQVPTQAGVEGEGGDTTGGGGDGRSDFRDTLASRLLLTDSTGRATMTIRLSDDLTSWHVTAAAMTAGLQAGVGDLLVPVGLPLFVEATIADSYLVTDHPAIRLRAFGEALTAGDAAEFTIASTTLGLAPTKLSGKAFAEVEFALPALTLGTHKIGVSVVAPTRTDAGGKPLTDRLIRSFTVVRSRTTTGQASYAVVGEPLPDVDTPEAALYTFTDAGRARYLPLLHSLAEPSGARLDRGLAASLARDLLVDAFVYDEATLPPATFDPGRYQIGVVEDEAGNVRAGVALVPQGGVDPWLAARVAVTAPGGISRSGDLREALRWIRDAESTQRDLWIASVAGLAGIGEPVIEELEAARAQSDLTIGERIWLAIGFEAVGDNASALAIERDLLRQHGQQLGPWVRLAAGTTGDEMVEATSLFAIVAAGLGDPLAPKMMDYAAANPSREASHGLDLAAAAGKVIERTPAAAASFAYTVDGKRTRAELEPGESVSLSLTAEQRASLTVERLSGQVGVAVAWRELADPSTLKPDSTLSIARSLPGAPDGALPSDRLVTVDLKVKFTDKSLEDVCYRVVEQVPSGLAPIAGSWDSSGGTIGPDTVVGQQVSFCASNTVESGRQAHLRYVARVVNSGTYTWEPAVMQLDGVPEAAALTKAGTIRIGGS